MTQLIEWHDCGSAPTGSTTGIVGALLRAALLITVALALVTVAAHAQVPAAPANMRAESGGNGHVRVSWDHPNDPSITGYESRIRVGSESRWRRDWTLFTSGAETTSDVITNIAPGVTILYALRARNANGPGSSSSVTVTARRRPAGQVQVSSTKTGLGGTVSLTAMAHDPDGGPLTYLWEAGAGSFDATDRASATWTAPSAAGRFQIRLTVTDDEGETGIATVDITVRGGGGTGDADDGSGGGGGGSDSPTGEISVNRLPSVSASCDPCRVRQGFTVRLEAEASDPDGDEVSYSWSAEQGSFIGETNGASALWRAPGEAGSMTIRVTVSDGEGGSASAEAVVAVDPLSDQSAIFASYLVSLPNEDPDQVIDTLISVSNVLSAPRGVDTAGGPYEGDTRVGTLEIHLYSRDDDQPMVYETKGDSPGDGLDENGRLAPGQTYTVRLAEIVGEDSAFIGYGWIVGNFDGIAGTRTIILGPGMAWHGDLTPKLSHLGAGVKPIPPHAPESNVVVADGRDWGDDPYKVNSAAIDGDRLTISVSFSGGCRRHDFTLVVSPTFRESDPVQLPAVLAHEANGDTCEAYPTESHVFDLTLVRTRYRQFYGPGPGRIILRIAGVAGDDLVYEFD